MNGGMDGWMDGWRGDSGITGLDHKCENLILTVMPLGGG